MPNQPRLSTLLTRREKKKESLSLAGQTDTVCRKTRFCPLISKEIESPFLSYDDYLQHSHSAKQQQRKQKMKLKNERNILPTRPLFWRSKIKMSQNLRWYSLSIVPSKQTLEEEEEEKEYRKKQNKTCASYGVHWV